MCICCNANFKGLQWCLILSQASGISVNNSVFFFSPFLHASSYPFFHSSFGLIFVRKPGTELRCLKVVSHSVWQPEKLSLKFVSETAPFYPFAHNAACFANLLSKLVASYFVVCSIFALNKMVAKVSDPLGTLSKHFITNLTEVVRLVGLNKTASDRFPRKLHCRQRVVCFQVQSGFIRRYWWSIDSLCHPTKLSTFFFFFFGDGYVKEKMSCRSAGKQVHPNSIANRNKTVSVSDCENCSCVFENSFFFFSPCELALTQVTSTKTREILSKQCGKWYGNGDEKIRRLQRGNNIYLHVKNIWWAVTAVCEQRLYQTTSLCRCVEVVSAPLHQVCVSLHTEGAATRFIHNWMWPAHAQTPDRCCTCCCTCVSKCRGRRCH